MDRLLIKFYKYNAQICFNCNKIIKDRYLLKIEQIYKKWFGKSANRKNKANYLTNGIFNITTRKTKIYI